MTAPVYELSNLCYPAKGTPILADATLAIPGESFTAILGANGAGKSTLLRLLAGHAPDYSGSIQMFGEPLGQLSGREWARRIGYLPQFHEPAFALPVGEVVLTGRAAFAGLMPGRDDRERARAAMAEVGIEHLAHRPYTEISGGERQLVRLARLVAQDPRVVLLDEPIAHLDLANQVRLLEVLRALVRAGRAVVAVLHDLNLAFRFSDHCVFLRAGRVAIPDQLPATTDFLREIFGVEIGRIGEGRDAMYFPKPKEST